MNIGLIFGGKTCEHEISCITAFKAYETLKEKYKVYLLYYDKDNNLFLLDMNSSISNYIKSNKKEIHFIKKGFSNGKTRIRLDVAILCTHGGMMEGGVLAGMMELFDIPYTSSNYASSAVVQDKIFTKMILERELIPQVKYNWFTSNINYQAPCIIKPATLGSSIGIEVCQSNDEINKGFISAKRYDDRILVENYHKDFRELNIAVLYDGDYICSNIEEVFKKDGILSFEDKYLSKDTLKTSRKIPAEISDDLKQEIIYYSKKICQTLNVKGVVRLDYLYDEELYFNEINNIPGALSYYLWDYSYLNLLEKLIKGALRGYQERQSKVFAYETNILDIKGIKK